MKHIKIFENFDDNTIKNLFKDKIDWKSYHNMEYLKTKLEDIGYSIIMKLCLVDINSRNTYEIIDQYGKFININHTTLDDNIYKKLYTKSGFVYNFLIYGNKDVNFESNIDNFLKDIREKYDIWIIYKDRKPGVGGCLLIFKILEDKE